MKRRPVSLRKALSDPKLLGNVLAGDSWLAWRVLLIAAAGELLTDAERAVFTSSPVGQESRVGLCMN
jgi:hypothetical protein